MWSRRRPVIAALLLGLVLVTVLGFAGVSAALVYALEGWHQAQQQRDVAEERTADSNRAAEEAQAARGREAEQRLAAETAGEREKEQRKDAEGAREREKKAREMAETNVTFGLLARARSDWRLHDLPGSLALLERVEPRRRGWEWRYLWGLHHGELMTLTRPQAAIMEGLSFSPDGRHLAAAAANPYGRRHDGTYYGEVAIWDARTGELVRTLGGFTHTASHVAYSPDGKSLAAVGLDGRLRVWKPETGRQTHSFDLHAGSLFDLAWARPWRGCTRTTARSGWWPGTPRAS
jgi:hypothetical protein